MNTDHKRKLFHVWLLPSIWVLCYLVTCVSHDTKRLSMEFASFAGAWITMLLSSLRGSSFWVARGIAGLCVVIPVAGLMDFLQVRRWVYLGLTPFALFGIWGLIGCFQKYPLDWVLKHDIGDPFVMISLGTYVVAVVSLIGVGVMRSVHHLREQRSALTSQSTIPQKANFLQNNEPILTNER